MRYVPELDGLRAIAVVAVVAFHADITGPFRGGFVGVDLFFVLSGFLITSLLVNEWKERGSLNLRRFYWRRFLRLMPPLLFLLVVYMTVAPFVWPGHPHARDALLAALYISDYTYPLTGTPHYLQHTWSLAIEEQFYLLWPLLLLGLLKARNPLPWLVAAYIGMMLWRGTFDDWQDYYYRLDTHATGLVLGAALYFLPFRGNPLMANLGLGLFFFLIMFAKAGRADIFFPIAEIAAACLIVSATNAGNLGTMLRSAPMVWAGRLSYGIYLWHGPIAFLVRDRLDFLSAFVVLLVTSTAMAWLSYVTIEAWARRVRRQASTSLATA